MTKILILVEGQTEETFIRQTVGPHLRDRDIDVIVTIATTKHVASGSDVK